MSRFNEMSVTTANALYQMIYDIGKILKNHKIPYWVDQRTLLGAMRSNGIIAWDKNVSFGIFQTDAKVLASLRKKFKEVGYFLKNTQYGYSISKKRPKIEINIFPYKLTDGKYQKVSKKARDQWPNQYYKPNELEKFGKNNLIEFGEELYSVIVPNNPNDVLTRFYGMDWDSMDILDGKKVKLTKKEKSPAVFDEELYDDPEDFDRPGVGKIHMKLVKSEQKKVNYKKDIVKQTNSCVLKKKCMTNFIHPMSIFVINCDVNKDRFGTFQKYAKKANVNICREKCVYGKKYTYNTLCEMRNKNFLTRTGDVTPVEVSIFMSHRNCWQRIANSCSDIGMVIEDDARLKPDFISKVNSVLKGLKDENIDFSILHLWNGRWMTENYIDDKNEKGYKDNYSKFLKIRNNLVKKDKIVLKTNKVNVFKETKEYNAGLVGYIMTKKFAKYLLNKSTKIGTAVDIFVGEQVKIGNHLSVQTNYNKKELCWESPMLDLTCEGEHGTGESTQDYGAPTPWDLKC